MHTTYAHVHVRIHEHVHVCNVYVYTPTAGVCDLPINRIDPLCKNEGKCINTGVLEYRCECLPGYEGRYCEIRVNYGQFNGHVQVYMYTCMHEHVHVHVHCTCIYVHVHVHCTCTLCIRTCTCTCTNVCACTHTQYMYMYMYIPRHILSSHVIICMCCLQVCVIRLSRVRMEVCASIQRTA